MGVQLQNILGVTLGDVWIIGIWIVMDMVEPVIKKALSGTGVLNEGLALQLYTNFYLIMKLNVFHMMSKFDPKKS